MAFKLSNLFKRRLKIVQEAYDLGWEHGYQSGKQDKHHEIVELIVDNVESIDWLKEEPYMAMDVLSMVKNHKNEEELLAVDDGTWRKP